MTDAKRESDEQLVDHITGKPVDPETGTQTTGHEWDGIRELDTPMPRWWLWTFYATIAISLVYFVLYPAIPLVSQATAGLLGYSSRAEVEDEMVRVTASRADVDAAIAAASLEEIVADPRLYTFAVRGGASNFKIVCSQCHGAGAAGSPGYPNLNDDDWLWGGSLEAIYSTIAHGIRNDDDSDARFSMMPNFGADGILTRPEIKDVAQYVVALSGRDHDAAAAARGKPAYEAQCVSCHEADGRGMPDQGAPNLADPIWLYGGDARSIEAQLWRARHGAMPPWRQRFNEAELKKLTAYVHSLGGTRRIGKAADRVPVAAEPSSPTDAD